MKTKMLSIEFFKSGRIKRADNEPVEKRESVLYWIKQIDKHGARPAVTVYKGRILDGNHRLKAYLILKHKAVNVCFLNTKDLTGFLFPRRLSEGNQYKGKQGGHGQKG